MRQSLVHSASKRRVLSKHKAGEVYGHREKLEHRAPLLFSALGCVAGPGVGRGSADRDATPGSADEV